MAPLEGGRSFRAFPPAPTLCERCWREAKEHAPDGSCPDAEGPPFGAAGW